MNKAEHLYRLGQDFYGIPAGKKVNGVPLPIRLWIEPTPYCNLKCPMCPQSDPKITDITKGKTHMDFELYKKIIDEAAGHVYDINLAHRGESTFHKGLPEMIQYASEKGIKTRLHTNATILNEKMSKAILDSGLDLLSFSFDGFKKEPYEKIRIGSNFEKTSCQYSAIFKNEKRGRPSKAIYSFSSD